MQVAGISIDRFMPSHLADAVRLSRQAGWPHRLEDWQLALALSEGVVALDELGDVVGTCLLTRYDGCATVNMVIVDETMRGRGVGKRLMDSVLVLAGDMPLRLVATMEGLPLYEKLGFVRTGSIVQHQGEAVATTATDSTEDATEVDLPAIAALDRIAFGADRNALIKRLAGLGPFAIVRRGGKVVGFSAMRSFGRGEVIGPVTAATPEDAEALILHFMSRRPGRFLRIDTGADTGLAPWLSARGLAHVGGGIVMARPPATRPAASATVFALANQALG